MSLIPLVEDKNYESIILPVRPLQVSVYDSLLISKKEYVYIQKVMGLNLNQENIHDRYEKNASQPHCRCDC